MTHYAVDVGYVEILLISLTCVIFIRMYIDVNWLIFHGHDSLLKRRNLSVETNKLCSVIQGGYWGFIDLNIDINANARFPARNVSFLLTHSHSTMQLQNDGESFDNTNVTIASDVMELTVDDEHLQRALVASWTSGSLLPLLKEELKLRIQTDRLSRGQNELQVNFSPRAHHPLRDDEVERRARRRDQNRQAAQRFRHRKRSQGHQLHQEFLELTRRNAELRDDVSRLTLERDQLLSQLSVLVEEGTTTQCRLLPPE